MARIKIEYSSLHLILLTLCLLILPLKWMVALIVAAAIHELGHCFAIHFCGGSIRKISVGLSGAQIEIYDLLPWQELLCALAGPAAGLSTVFLIRWFPRVALCAFAQSTINLMPIYPLDGGRAVRCWAELFGARNWVCTLLEIACLTINLALGMYCTCVFDTGLITLLLPSFLAYRMIQGKISCKEGDH